MSTPAYCGSCKAAIRWVTTEGGKNMPLDWDPTETGNVVPRVVEGDVRTEVRAHILRDDEQPRPDENRYSTHWQTCPDADKHRKGR